MSDVAYLVLRVLFSIVFLNAAWQCGKSKEGVKWTIEESRILFGKWAPIFGVGGIGVMAVGGLSVLLGIYPEIGASMLTVFLLLGSVIHFRRQKDSVRIGEELSSNGQDVGELTTLASLGHYSSAMKNYSLCGPSAFIAMTGGGAYVISSLWS